MSISLPMKRWMAALFRKRSTAVTSSRSMCWAAVCIPMLTMGLASSVDAQTISPRRLLEVSDPGNPVLSPDGRYVAFRVEQASVERNRYDSTWYVQPLDGLSLPLRISDGGEPLREYVTGVALPSPCVWSPDGRWLYYRARLNGRVSVWRAATDGSQVRAVTSDAADVRDFVLSDDGRALRYSTGAAREDVVAAETREYESGVRIDETVMIAGGLFRSSRVEGHPTTQRFQGDWFTPGPLLAQVPDRWKTVDLATMATHELSASDVPARPLSAADLPHGLPAPTKVARHPGDARIAVLLPGADKGDGLFRPLEVELAVLPHNGASRPVRCEDTLCRDKAISDIQWRPGSDEVLFTVTEHHKGRAQSIYGWDVVTDVVRPVVLSDGLVSGGQRHWDVPCALSVDSLVCVAAEADHPPRLEVIDVVSGQRRILLEPNKGLQADIAATVPARLISWKDERGREFTGQLFEARNAGEGGPPPLFVTFYACQGFMRGGVGDEWALASLAEQGISALCINALPGFRQDFVERHDQGRAAVESVVAMLSAAGRIDRTRVGMGGLSFGSEVTLWTLAHSNVVTAASVSGVSATPSYYLFNSMREAFRNNLEQMWQLGAPDQTPERWREISPAFHLDKIRAPVLFQVPEQEYRMLLEYVVPLVRRKQGDLYVFPEEAHVKFQPLHKLAVYERNTDWFRFWLQDYEDPDPVKAEQYRVWREMKAGAVLPVAQAVTQ